MIDFYVPAVEFMACETVHLITAVLLQHRVTEPSLFSGGCAPAGAAPNGPPPSMAKPQVEYPEDGQAGPRD